MFSEIFSVRIGDCLKNGVFELGECQSVPSLIRDDLCYLKCRNLKEVMNDLTEKDVLWWSDEQLGGKVEDLLDDEQVNVQSA